MEKLTKVSPAPGEEPVLGWSEVSWREYAEHSLTHDNMGAAASAVLAWVTCDPAAVGQAETKGERE